MGAIVHKINPEAPIHPDLPADRRRTSHTRLWRPPSSQVNPATPTSVNQESLIWSPGRELPVSWRKIRSLAVPPAANLAEVRREAEGDVVARKTPQEKKRLSYARDCRTTYGEHGGGTP